VNPSPPAAPGDAPGIRFSVLITSYNYRDYVAEALDSVFAQDYPAARVVVVDDGSSDGTRELLTQRYAGNAAVELVLKENGGQLSAFAAGISRCEGDVVCFLDADDRWEPGYLSTLAAFYRDTPGADFVFTNLRKFGQDQGPWAAAFRTQDYGLSALQALHLRRWVGMPTSALSMRLDLGRRLLDLPAEIIADWRKAGADDCLILGASVLGARKYSLASELVGYRVHGRNSLHTWRAGDAISRCRKFHTTQRLLEHYALRAGLSRNSLCFSKYEFATMRRRPLSHLIDYLKLLGLAPLHWLDRIEHSGWMIKHYVKGRFG
jgi:glycosyltransferase involved in cell wall biosynthesis